MEKSNTVLCYITKVLVNEDNAKIGLSIRPSVMELIKKSYPYFSIKDYICNEELFKFKTKHIQDMLEDDKGQLSDIQKQVADTVAKHDFMSMDFTKEEKDSITFGERISDKIAEFGGSWKFIISFLSFMFMWICVNAFVLCTNAFDPFPFIFLNLILSCLAALQAPVIMMSQNRTESKDRKRGINDFKVNLKSEIEIRHLHEKMDHLIITQVKHIHEMQQMQMDILTDINEKMKYLKK